MHVVPDARKIEAILFDMNDVFAHPEKYRNHEVKGTVRGVEQLKSRVAQMKAQAEALVAALESSGGGA